MENQNLEEFITNHPDWYIEKDELVTGFEFADFGAVKTIMPKLLQLIEKVDHHPMVTFGYNSIEIRTTTHDKGNKITDKDLSLAEEISNLIAQD